MRWVSSRKGVSEIIAALLVIMITISAGTLFAAYASGLMGSMQKQMATQPYIEQISSEDYTWTTLNSLTVNVRNTGAATVNLQTADYYLVGVLLSAPSPSCSTGSATSVAPGTVCTISWSSLTASSYSAGVAYVLKVVLTKDGATFTFTLVAGSATH
jgi:flagellin-like protein